MIELIKKGDHLKRREHLLRKVWRFFFVLVLSTSLAYLPSFSFGGEVDILIEKLVEKGLLTKQDAESVLEEIRQKTAKQEKEKQKEEAKKIEGKEAELPQWAKKLPDFIINPPEWIKNIKFSGDLRLRYQWEDRKDDDKEVLHGCPPTWIEMEDHERYQSSACLSLLLLWRSEGEYTR